MLKWSFGTRLEIIGARRKERPPRQQGLTPLHKWRGIKKKKGEKKYESTKAENEILADSSRAKLASGFLKQKRFTKEKVFNKKNNPFVFTKPNYD